MLSGRPLEDAETLSAAVDVGDVDLHLAVAEQDLVTSSLAARDQARAREAARREQERELERRSSMRLRALVALVAVAALVAGSFWYLADRRASITAVNELVAQSAAVVESDPDLGLLLALAAHERWRDGPTMSDDGVEAALHAGIEEQRLVRHFPDAGKVLAVDPTGELFVTTRFESRTGSGLVLDLHDTMTGAVVRSFAIEGEGEPTAAFSPNGQRLVTGADTEFLQEWDVASGEELRRLKDTLGTTNLQVSGFDPSGSLLVGHHWWRSFDVEPQRAGRTIVWDTATGEIVRELPRLPDDSEFGDAFGPAGAVFSPDGSQLAIVPYSHPDSTQVIDVATWEEAYRVPATEDQAVTTAAWSPDGDWLALGGHQVRIVDAATGRIHRDLTHPDGFPGQHGMAWAPDSQQL